MDLRLIARAAALGLAATALLTAVIFAWVLVHAYVVAPGHEPALYQAYAARVAPIAGILVGIPLFALAGHFAVRRHPYDLALAVAPAATFILIDLALLASLQRAAFAAWPLLLLSWLSKLAAAALGGRLASRPSAA
jgi:hypothetical protein